MLKGEEMGWKESRDRAGTGMGQKGLRANQDLGEMCLPNEPHTLL